MFLSCHGCLFFPVGESALFPVNDFTVMADDTIVAGDTDFQKLIKSFFQFFKHDIPFFR